MNNVAVVDTSILISFYNHGFFQEEFIKLNRENLIFFSAVTINEFIRGAHNKTSKEIVRDFLEITNDQIITPTKEQWIECGNISEQVLKGKKRSKEAVLLLQNDILIALGAKDLHAVLVTADQDFKMIGEQINSPILFWSQKSASEPWLNKNLKAKKSMERGIAQAKAGKLIKANEDFTKYIDDSE